MAKGRGMIIIEIIEIIICIEEVIVSVAIMVLLVIFSVIEEFARKRMSWGSQDAVVPKVAVTYVVVMSIVIVVIRIRKHFFPPV